jgi:hypothetical protein
MIILQKTELKLYEQYIKVQILEFGLAFCWPLLVEFILNLLSYELLIVCGWISSISYCFCDKIKQKVPTKALSVINSTRRDQQKLFL